MKVEAVEKEEAEDELGGLGSALLNALSQRSTAIHGKCHRHRYRDICYFSLSSCDL